MRSRRCVLLTCAAPPKELHRMLVEREPVQRAKRFSKLIHCRAIDIFHSPARPANRMMVMMRRLAPQVRRFTLRISPRRDIPAIAQMLERAIHRRKRHPRPGTLQPPMNFRRRNKPRLPLQNRRDPLPRPSNIIRPTPHNKTTICETLANPRLCHPERSRRAPPTSAWAPESEWAAARTYRRPP
jgi:hypothetical protein